MGSTDGQGNRASNLPGEGRDSLTSVTPYDDDPTQLIRKVEKVVQDDSHDNYQEQQKKLLEQAKKNIVPR